MTKYIYNYFFLKKKKDLRIIIYNIYKIKLYIKNIYILGEIKKMIELTKIIENTKLVLEFVKEEINLINSSKNEIKNYSNGFITKIIDSFSDKKGLIEAIDKHIGLLNESENYENIEKDLKTKERKLKALIKTLESQDSVLTGYKFQTSVEKHLPIDVIYEDVKDNTGVNGFSENTLLFFNKYYLEQEKKYKEKNTSKYLFYFNASSKKKFENIAEYLFKEQIKNKKEIKMYLDAFAMEKDSNIDNEYEIVIDLMNNNLAEFKGWLILALKDKIENGTEFDLGIPPNIIKLFQIINKKSEMVNWHRPFIISKDGKKLERFNSAKKGEVDHLYYVEEYKDKKSGLMKQKIVGMATTSDLSGTIDSKIDEMLYLQQLPRHLLKTYIEASNCINGTRYNFKKIEREIVEYEPNVPLEKNTASKRMFLKLNELEKEVGENVEFIFFQDASVNVSQKSSRLVETINAASFFNRHIRNHSASSLADEPFKDKRRRVRQVMNEDDEVLYQFLVNKIGFLNTKNIISLKEYNFLCGNKNIDNMENKDIKDDKVEKWIYEENGKEFLDKIFLDLNLFLFTFRDKYLELIINNKTNRNKKLFLDFLKDEDVKSKLKETSLYKVSSKIQKHSEEENINSIVSSIGRMFSTKYLLKSLDVFYAVYYNDKSFLEKVSNVFTEKEKIEEFYEFIFNEVMLNKLHNLGLGFALTNQMVKKQNEENEKEFELLKEEKDKKIEEKDKKIEEKDKKIEEKDKKIEEKDKKIEEILKIQDLKNKIIVFLVKRNDNAMIVKVINSNLVDELEDIYKKEIIENILKIIKIKKYPNDKKQEILDKIIIDNSSIDLLEDIYSELSNNCESFEEFVEKMKDIYKKYNIDFLSDSYEKEKVVSKLK
jgi:hypothetical protein